MFFSTSAPMLVSRQFGDEIVLANYASGIYYNLGGTGAQIWLGIRAGKTTDEIVDVFSENAAASSSIIDQSVRAFVDHLVIEGIIIPGRQASDSEDWSPSITDEFSEPQLERFDDLRDLLLMDPVHDVSESGWPIRGGDAG